MLANNLFGLANRSEMAVLAAMYGIAIVDVSDDTEPDEIDMYLLKKLKVAHAYYPKSAIQSVLSKASMANVGIQTKVESETKKMITDALVRRSAGNGYVLVDGKAHALEALQLALEGCTGYRAEALAVVKAWAKSSTGSC